jgi:acyl carrier protein
MTDLEQRVAAEIARIARHLLGLAAGPPGAGEALLGAGTAPLADQLDSLMLLSLVVAVEDRFQIVLADDAAAGTRSLEDLARLVAARAAPEHLP